MAKIDLLGAVPPCALFCHTCFGYKRGALQYHASHLFELYKGWYEGHVQAWGDNPTPEQQKRLEDIQTFNMMLQKLMNPNCPGCRESNSKGEWCISGCIVLKCTRQHGVDYCGFCPEFPCNKNDAIFSTDVMKKWLEGNKYIKEHGVEAYFQKYKLVAHFIECCNNDK